MEHRIDLRVKDVAPETTLVYGDSNRPGGIKMASPNRRATRSVAAAAVLAVLVGIVGPQGFVPAGAQGAPLPTVMLSVWGNEIQTYISCDGEERIPRRDIWGFHATLDSPAPSDLEIPLSFSNGYTAEGLRLDSLAFMIRAGDTTGEMTAYTDGPDQDDVFTATVEPGAGYVGGASVDVAFTKASEHLFVCEHDEVTLHASVGDSMPNPYQPIDVDVTDYTPGGGPVPPAPGISGRPFEPLTGTLTEAGTFQIRYRYASPHTLPIYILDITLIVAAGAGPSLPATPAVPLPASPQLTG